MAAREDELQNYIAFRQLRRILAELAHTSPGRLDFTRRDWEQEWPTLQDLRMHFSESGLACYIPAGLGSHRFNVQ